MGDTTRGWRRFRRGVNTVRSNPTHAGAKIWRRRIESAQPFDAEEVKLRRFQDGTRYVDDSGGSGGWYNYHTVPQYRYLCSDFCATVASEFVAFKQVEVITTRDISRTVTCFACGRVVRPDGTTDDSQRVDFTIPPLEEKSPVENFDAARDELTEISTHDKIYYYDLTNDAVVPEIPDVREVRVSAHEETLIGYMNGVARAMFLKDRALGKI